MNPEIGDLLELGNFNGIMIFNNRALFWYRDIRGWISEVSEIPNWTVISSL